MKQLFVDNEKVGELVTWAEGNVWLNILAATCPESSICLKRMQ